MVSVKKTYVCTLPYKIPPDKGIYRLANNTVKPIFAHF